MDGLKGALEQTIERLAEVEKAARELPNHHFADIIMAAKGRLHDASGHPDIGLVQAKMDGEIAEDQKSFPFAGGVFNAKGELWKEGDGPQFDGDAKPI